MVAPTFSDADRALKDIERLAAEVRRLREESDRHLQKAIAELAANGGLMTERDAAKADLARAIAVLRSFRDNWDCDNDAHKYATECRCCAAKAFLAEMEKR